MYPYPDLSSIIRMEILKPKENQVFDILKMYNLYKSIYAVYLNTQFISITSQRPLSENVTCPGKLFVLYTLPNFESLNRSIIESHRLL